MLFLVICIHCLFVGCRRPAAEQLERLLRPRAGLGGVDPHGQAGIGNDVHRLEAELEFADEWMAHVFDAAVVDAHVVRRPERSEELATGRELADEVGEFAVVRIAAGLRTQDRDDVRGDGAPLGVEAVRPVVEEDEARGIRRLRVALEVL